MRAPRPGVRARANQHKYWLGSIEVCGQPTRRVSNLSSYADGIREDPFVPSHPLMPLRHQLFCEPLPTVFGAHGVDSSRRKLATPCAEARFENYNLDFALLPRIFFAGHACCGADDPSGYYAVALYESFRTQSNARRRRRSHFARSNRQRTGAACSRPGFEFWLAAGDLSPEYRIGGGSVALESAGNLERSRRKRIFYRLGEPHGVPALFVRIFSATSWIHSQRRNRQRRLFAPDGRRHFHLLEK